MIVMHGRLGEAQTGVLKAPDHLDADRSAGRSEPHSVVAGATHQPEITIDVSNLYSEREPDDPAINVTNDDAVQRVRAADFVSIHHIHIIDHKGNELLQLSDVVLRVSVGVKDPFFCSALEPRSQRA